MTIEINQRGERNWAVYVSGEYKGTVSRISDYFVATHTRKRFWNRDDAVEFLIARVSA